MTNSNRSKTAKTFVSVMSLKSAHTGSEQRARRRKKKKSEDKDKDATKNRTGLISPLNRVKNHAMSKSFETTAEVLKVDDELGIVFGWGIICTEKGENYFDTQGDHIPDSTMLKATSEFMYEIRAAGEMHARHANGDAVHKGVIVHSMPLTKDLAEAFGITTEKTGWLIGMKPDSDMLEKFRDGTYKGFSIGGLRGEDEDAD